MGAARGQALSHASSLSAAAYFTTCSHRGLYQIWTDTPVSVCDWHTLVCSPAVSSCLWYERCLGCRQQRQTLSAGDCLLTPASLEASHAAATAVTASVLLAACFHAGSHLLCVSSAADTCTSTAGTSPASLYLLCYLACCLQSHSKKIRAHLEKLEAKQTLTLILLHMLGSCQMYAPDRPQSDQFRNT